MRGSHERYEAELLNDTLYSIRLPYSQDGPKLIGWRAQKVLSAIDFRRPFWGLFLENNLASVEYTFHGNAIPPITLME